MKISNLKKIQCLLEANDPFFVVEQYIDKLKLINLEHSINLITTPNFIGVPRLEKLCLRGCINLVEIEDRKSVV